VVVSPPSVIVNVIIVVVIVIVIIDVMVVHHHQGEQQELRRRRATAADNGRRRPLEGWGIGQTEGASSEIRISPQGIVNVPRGESIWQQISIIWLFLASADSICTTNIIICCSK
jgi:hypothetical protein